MYYATLVKQRCCEHITFVLASPSAHSLCVHAHLVCIAHMLLCTIHYRTQGVRPLLYATKVCSLADASFAYAYLAYKLLRHLKAPLLEKQPLVQSTNRSLFCEHSLAVASHSLPGNDLAAINKLRSTLVCS